MYDTNNYLVTATNIHGPWSEPIALNNFGFDPSLFHDEDGRKYMVSMVTDHRVPKKYAGRLVLQEYDAMAQKMTGPVKDIYAADKIFLEGPHIFKRNGWYYLFSADTGTGEGHGQTIQRSRSVWGPYEMYQPEFIKQTRTADNEAYSILTSRHHPELALQKAGHADLVETPEGEWYMVHLCGRPLENRNPENAKRFAGCRRYPLGRETAIQKVRWTDDDWLLLDSQSDENQNIPQVEVPAPKGVTQITPVQKKTWRDDFMEFQLQLDYQSLRVSMDEHYMSLTARPGVLRMYGRSGLSSKFSQSLIAKRWKQFQFTTTTELEFEPESFKQMAGLVMMYDTDNYLYLHLSCDEEIGKCITILKAENRNYEYPIGYLPIQTGKKMILRAEVNYDQLQFYFAYDEGKKTQMQKIGPVFDCSFLSDEACDEGWFTGAMSAICCQDLTGFGKEADFHYWEIKNTES